MKKRDQQLKKPKAPPPFPGMMGDGTEEQNLNQRGDKSARISQSDVQAAFAKGKQQKGKRKN